MNSSWDRVWGGPCLSNLDCTDYISICFISTPGIGNIIVKLYSTALLVYSTPGIGNIIVTLYRTALLVYSTPGIGNIIVTLYSTALLVYSIFRNR